STKKLSHYTRQADIIISAVGKHNLICGSMIKSGAIVIDAGFSTYNGKIAGDINLSEVMKKAKLVTPTPGGVGPITVAKLMANVVANAEYLLKKG
ncbi:MAG: bifunctional methylenetetrahydrofolate dehydrogenase/methenyltetrahydrofolate cyclohydrolase, partial [Patescibacteria group bacterium]